MATFDSQVNNFENASDCVDKDLCQPCSVLGKSNYADMFCFDCQEYLCSNCTVNHKAFKVFRNHSLLTLDQMLKNPTIKKDKCSMKCSVHKDKTVKYFCGNHAVFWCSVCANIEHKKCDDVQYIPTIAATLESDSEFKQFSENLSGIDTAAKVLTLAIKNKIAQSNSEPEHISKAIERVRDDVNAKLDQLKKQMIRQAESIKKEQTNKLQTLSTSFVATRSSIEHLKHQTDTLIKDGQNCDAFVLMKTNTSKLESLKEKIKVASNIPVKHATFRPKLVKMEEFGDLDVQEAQVEPNIRLPDFKQQATASDPRKGSASNDTKQVVDQLSSKEGKRSATALQLQVGSRVKYLGTKQFRIFLFGRCPGTVVEMPSDLASGYVKVKWDSGHTMSYCLGRNGSYDLEIID